MPEHISALLRKAQRLGLDAASLETLAIQRGCRYYSDGEKDHSPNVSEAEFSNSELAIALLHPSLPYRPQRIRVGAAMLSAEGGIPSKIARLAIMERAEPIVEYIAQCGSRFEPENRFWKELLAQIRVRGKVDSSNLPHPTRFVAMTGITPRGRELVTQWIRPGRTPALVHG